MRSEQTARMILKDGTPLGTKSQGTKQALKAMAAYVDWAYKLHHGRLPPGFRQRPVALPEEEEAIAKLEEQAVAKPEEEAVAKPEEEAVAKPEKAAAKLEEQAAVAKPVGATAPMAAPEEPAKPDAREEALEATTDEEDSDDAEEHKDGTAPMHHQPQVLQPPQPAAGSSSNELAAADGHASEAAAEPLEVGLSSAAPIELSSDEGEAADDDVAPAEAAAEAPAEAAAEEEAVVYTLSDSDDEDTTAKVPRLVY